MKKAVVTGHSKGLGLAMTRQLLERGYQVLGLSRTGVDDIAGLHQMSLNFADTGTVIEFAGQRHLPNFLENATSAVLINNAGVVKPVAPTGRQAPDAIAVSVAVNVTAPLVLSNAFVSATHNAGDRRIMHVSSGAARKGFTGWGIYCATKAALDLHTEATAMDNVPNLCVCSLAPGIVDTDMQATLRDTPKEDFALLEKFQGFKADGDLLTPDAAASAMVGNLHDARFGSVICTDIREL